MIWRLNRPLAAVLVFAFVVRVWGIRFGLPDIFHQDEPIVVNHALAYGTGDLNPHFFKIPPLLSYLVFFVFGIYYLVLAAFRQYSPDDFALSFFRDPSSFYFLARFFFGALLGTASVWALYRLGRRFLSEAGALLAAFFFAASYLHARDSHYVYADIPMIFSMLMAFLYFADFQDEKKGKAFNLSAVWMGVAAAFKYIAAPAIVPVLAAVFFVQRQNFLRWAVKYSLIAGLAYLALNPFSFLDFGFFMKELHQQAGAEGSMPFWHHLQYSLFEGHGAAAVVMGWAGLFWLAFKNPRGGWLAGLAVLWYLVIAFFSQPYERYAMPVVPLLCVGAAFFLETLGSLSKRRWAFLLLAVLAALPSMRKIVHLDRLLTRPDTRTEAKAWFLENIPAGSAVALDHAFFSPRLKQADEQLAQKSAGIGDAHRAAKEKKLKLMRQAQEGETAYRVFYLDMQGLGPAPFISWSPLIEPTRAELEKHGVRYLVRYRYPGEKAPDGGIMEGFERVKIFSPYYSEKTMTEDEWANVSLPFRSSELFSRKSPGPYLEIYEAVR